MWGPIAGLSIDEGESADTGKCSDCASQTRAVWGYVSKNGGAHAAYYAAWTDAHLDRGVKMLISVGRWGEGSTPAMRKMIGLDCRMGKDGRPSFMVIDASKIQLDEDGLFGQGLTRNEVMNDPGKNEVFMIADHVTFVDNRIKSFLLGQPA